MVHLTVALERQAQEPLDGAAATLWDVHKLMVATQHKRRAVLCTRARRGQDACVTIFSEAVRDSNRVMLPVHQTIIGHRYRIPRTRPRRHQWEQNEEVHDDDRPVPGLLHKRVDQRVAALLFFQRGDLFLLVILFHVGHPRFSPSRVGHGPVVPFPAYGFAMSEDAVNSP